MNDARGGGPARQGGSGATREFEELVTLLENPDPGVRAEAAEAFAGFGREADVPLMRALEDADHRVQGSARRALAKQGFACLRALIGGLERPGSVEQARSLIHGIFRKTPGAQQYLGMYGDVVEALPSMPRLARSLAALSLTRLARSEELRESHADLVPFLIEALSSEMPVEQKEAALCLARIAAVTSHASQCPLGEDAIQDLTLALDAEDSALRYAAAWALEKCGPAAQAAIPGLQVCLSDPDPLVQRSAAWALERIEDQ